MSQTQDEKPKLQPVLIRFILPGHPDGISVKIGPNKPMAKAIDAVCAKLQLNPKHFRFTYDGESVRADDTPAGCKMLEDEGAYTDEGIEVQGHAFQEGGC
ncbi:hypothetical protein EXIGLDRAFT_831883 [Exidia glandulosa HHB12029]|uniref:Ubiquitin-like domain-containing protein n=1 Tax=Exidia glandulosa HHB12029 TaxID=1314781 RepID=A0A165M7W9_EXIGL|nr:hypothetical protein EXIGLDRAFT_831883 [Exidia glandulosa HHB12029]